MKKTILFLFFCASMHSQNVNVKINSGGVCNNVLNYEIGLIDVKLAYSSPPKERLITSTRDDTTEPISSSLISLNYYPNPVMDKLFLQADDSKTILAFEVEVYNMFGQLVIKKKIAENYIDFSGLSRGTYHVISTNDDFKAFNILKK